MSKLRLFFLTAVMLLVSAKAYALSAQSAVLIDGHTGRVIQEVNAYQRRGMASTTKIMTAIVAIEKGELDEVVEVSANASGVEGSSIWLRVGERITLRDLLYGLMLNSGNDAATAIAEAVAGSVDEFSVLMNEKAEELGLQDTHFTNPHGLAHDQHYTTAYDLAQLTRYALQNPEFAEIVSTKNKVISNEPNTYGRHLSNHNKMLRLYPDANGVKTGFTKKDGRCLVSSATRNGLTLIVVTLNAHSDWDDHAQLLDYGFDNYTLHRVLSAGQQLKTLSVSSGKPELIPVTAACDLDVAVKPEELPYFELTYDLPNALKAPVDCGEVVGTVRVSLKDKEIAAVDLVSGSQSVHHGITNILDGGQDEEGGLLNRILNFFKGIFNL